MSYCTLSEAIDGNGCPVCTKELAALRAAAKNVERIATYLRTGRHSHTGCPA